MCSRFVEPVAQDLSLVRSTDLHVNTAIAHRQLVLVENPVAEKNTGYLLMKGTQASNLSTESQVSIKTQGLHQQNLPVARRANWFGHQGHGTALLCEEHH